jgi:hypothetical protein
MLTSNQRGRGKEPVVVLGSIRSAVAVNVEVFSGDILSKARSAVNFVDNASDVGQVLAHIEV